MTTKLQVGTAACAIAAAAAIIPVAQAAPALHMPTAPVTQILAEAPVLGPGMLAQDWFYFGAPSPGHPPVPPFIVFSPLLITGLPALAAAIVNIPIIGPIIGAGISFFAGINYVSCIGGLNGRIGPYGTLSAGFGGFGSGGC